MAVLSERIPNTAVNFNARMMRRSLNKRNGFTMRSKRNSDGESVWFVIVTKHRPTQTQPDTQP